MQKKGKRIILLGAGAIGTVFAERLCAGEYEFSVAADAVRAERYRRDGIFFCGRRLDLDITTPQSGQPSADIVIVALKNYVLEEALEIVAPIVSDRTVIISFMNGITSEKRIARRFPSARVMYGFYIGHTATRRGNDTWQDGNYITVVGDYPSTPKAPSQAVVNIVDTLSSAGIRIEARKQMESEIWRKFAVNVCLNQTTAYFGCTYGEITGEKRDLFDALAREVQEVAIAENIPGATEYSGYVKEVLSRMSSGDRSSMAQDVIAGNRTEIEDFAGEVIRIAERHGINVPANRKVYSSIK